MSEFLASGGQSVGVSALASVLPCSSFFMVQLSHPFMTTGDMTATTNCGKDSLKSLFFTLGDQSIGDSASASVLPMNIQD